MTIEQLVCVFVGTIVQAVTFALGIMVGVSLKRKESFDDSDSYEKASRPWHTVERR